MSGVPGFVFHDLISSRLPDGKALPQAMFLTGSFCHAYRFYLQEMVLMEIKTMASSLSAIERQGWPSFLNMDEKNL